MADGRTYDITEEINPEGGSAGVYIIIIVLCKTEKISGSFSCLKRAQTTPLEALVMVFWSSC